MKKPLVTIVGTTLTFCVVVTLAAETPKGWFRAGSNPKEYEMVVDCSVAHSGSASASLKCIASRTSGFGTLMQTFSSDSFRGKRLRLSGYVRAKEVSDSAGLWMRVDGPKNEVLAFDNMQQRAVKGTRDWQKYEIVLDVPEQADQIAFGLLLTGSGQVWMDDLKFEVVGTDVPTTGVGLNQRIPKEPTNLDFEE